MTDDLAAFLDAAEERARFRRHPCSVAETDVPALVGMVRAVLALYPKAEDTRADVDDPADVFRVYVWPERIRGDLRAALLSAIPPTPTAEETR